MILETDKHMWGEGSSSALRNMLIESFQGMWYKYKLH